MAACGLAGWLVDRLPAGSLRACTMVGGLPLTRFAKNLGCVGRGQRFLRGTPAYWDDRGPGTAGHLGWSFGFFVESRLSGNKVLARPWTKRMVAEVKSQDYSLKHLGNSRNH